MRLPPLFCLLFLAAQLAAQRDGSDYAYFFPVTKYSGSWPDLPGTETELTNIKSDMTEIYGFKGDLYPNLSKKQIKEKLAELAKRTFGKNDQLLLYFSMHGSFDEFGDAGCLCPSGAQDNDPTFETWLLHTELATLVNRIRCEHILLVIDACYSGTFGDKKGDRPDGAAFDEPLDCRATIARELDRKTRFYIAAGGKERVPANSELAKKWRTALGSNGGQDGILTLTELLLNIGNARPTPKFGNFGGDLGGQFVFVSKYACKNIQSAPVATTSQEQKDRAAWELAKAKNTADAYKKYMTDFPNGDFVEVAQVKLDNFKPEKSPDKPDARTDNMVFIRGGTFQMGSEDGEADEKPPHEVEISNFFLAKYETTVAEFKLFVDDTGYLTDAEKNNDEGSYFWDGTAWKLTPGINWRHDADGKLRPQSDHGHPVIHVSWNDAKAYIDWFSQKTGKTYRFPTEAEWEYAAGNGTKHTKYSWGNGDPAAKNGGNVADKSAKTRFSGWTIFEKYDDGFIFTAPIGSFSPNDLGLHDMTGNVLEWCSDWYDENYYKNAPARDPSGPAQKTTYRVCRGGSWYNDPRSCRVASRSNNAPESRSFLLGFRLARSAQ